MTDYPKAIAALREARTKFDAEVARVAGPQTLRHRAEELSARVLDFLDALDAAQGEAVATVQTITSLVGETRKCIIGPAEVIDSLPVGTAVYAAPPAALAEPAGYVPVSALIEAREEVESWAAYATPYFQDKHDLAGVLAEIDGQIAAATQAPPAAVSLPAPLPPAPDTMNLTEAQREIEDAFRRGWNSCRATVMQATPAAAVPEGYALVPVEPTEAMLDAGHAAAWRRIPSCFDMTDAEIVYRAMLAAAQAEN